MKREIDHDPTIVWLADELHLWRLVHLGRNPMIRTADRVETVLLMVVVMCGILLLPMAFLAADVAYSSGVVATEVQRQQRHPVVATMTGAAQSQSPVVTARWQRPDGSVVVGAIPSETSDRVGSSRTIWIDRQGQSTNRPQPAETAVIQAVLAGLAVAALLTFGTLVTTRAITAICSRGRLRSWQDEWETSRLGARN